MNPFQIRAIPSERPETENHDFYLTAPYIALIGPVGCGKTTIAQKLSRKTDLGVRGFGFSATRQSTVYKTRSFVFVDTPGYLSFRDKLDHAVTIIRALEELPLSRIMLLMRFEERIDLMLQKLQEVFSPLRSLSDITTVLITAIDLSDGSDQTKLTITDEILKTFEIRSVLFSGIKTSSDELESLFKSTLTVAPRALKIPTDQIFLHFNLRKNDMKVLEFIREKRGLYATMVTSARQRAESIETLSEKVDFVLLAQVALKSIAEKWKEEFIEQFEVDTCEPEELAWVDQLHCELTTLLKTFRSYCKEIRNYATDCASDHPFRKCPVCGEVWIKVEGCDGKTTCGARPSGSDRVRNEWRWNWKYIEDALFFWKDGPESEQQEGKAAINSRTPQAAETTPTGKGRGCGAEIEWKLMAPVPIPEDMIETPSATSMTDITVVPKEDLDKAYEKINKEKSKVQVKYEGI